MITYELAKQLKEAGFPSVTRWEVENNQRRHITVTGEEPLPPFGALLSEIKGYFILVRYGEKYIASSGLDNYFDVEEAEYPDTKSNREAGYAGKKFLRVRLDGGLINPCMGDTPEEAVSRLWLLLNNNTQV